MRYKVHNIVLTVEFSNKLDLPQIAKKLKGSEYVPDQFPGLIYRMDNPDASFLIFSSGKMNCTGVTNLEDAKRAINKMLSQFKKMKFKVFKPRIEVQNIVASTELKRKISFTRLLELENSEYEPEQFPGLVYRTDKGIAFLIFSDGKVVCVGARTTKDIKASIEELVKKLREIKAFV
jgi:transcription initiation factor TFIID TATA-box-binding protein